MKKLFKNLSLLLLVSFGIILINSCVKTPECESQGYNNVIIKNDTGVDIYVDVTYVGSDYNDERYIRPGGTTTYRRMNSGTLWVWGTAGYGWERNTINTRPCQDFTYTWYATKDGEVTMEIGWEDGGFIEESEYNQPPNFEMSKSQ